MALTDISGRGLKAQMKYADKIGAGFSLVIGDNELETGKCNLKNMQTGETREVTIPDGLIGAVYESKISVMLEGIENATESFGMGK